MVEAPRPPVNEVVLSVALTPQAALSGPLLAAVLGEWFQSHPGIQTVPRYDMPPEPEDFGGPIPGVGLQVIAALPEPRYWLISPDDREVVQVQPNYLALNWRRRDMPPDYPGYPALRDRFVGLLVATQAGLNRQGGSLQPTRAEITYINVIQPSAEWSSHPETHKLINFVVADAMEYERLSFSFSQIITTDEQGLVGRLHVMLQPSFDWLKQEPQLTLTITCRSTDLRDQSVAAALSFLDLAHERANLVFLGLVTENARRAWGLK